MTNKELLELAAKAAGIELRIYEGMVVEPGTDFVTVDANTGIKWNPLDISTGDALRLAVKLGLHIGNYGASCDVTITRTRLVNTISFREEHKDDPYAATCRAIVRAAAEIGRTM